MIFFKIIITSPKTLAAVGTLTLPNYTANKGSSENVRVKRRPKANPTPWIHHLVTELATNLPDLAKEGWGYGMSFPQTANVGVKLPAYKRTLLVPSSKCISIVTAVWEAFGEHLYYNSQAFPTVGVQKAIFGDTRPTCANDGLGIHSSTSHGIVLTPFSKLEGTWLILSLWPLHPALKKSSPLKISWRLEHFWGEKNLFFDI